MGPKAEDDSYLPCLKCKALIPQYVKEIHATECHTLKQRSFTHPLISGLSILGQALIIGNQNISTKKTSSKNKSIKQNETKEKNSSKMQRSGTDEKNKEPEWLKKIMPGSHYRIAIINELDMIRCKIIAYTSVLLEHGGHSCAFIAVPDSELRIGHVMLHRIGCMQYFPSLAPNALIWIKKINDVKPAEQIVLLPRKELSDEECAAMESHLKSRMFSSYPLGSPYTVRTDSRVYPHSSDGSDSHLFTVCNCIALKCSSDDVVEDQLIMNMKGLHLEGRDLEKSPSTSYKTDAVHMVNTNNSVGEHSSLFNATDNQDGSSFASGGYITLDEYNEGDSLDELKTNDSFLTSTPNKTHKSSASGLCKSLLTSKLAGNLTSSSISEGKDISVIDKSAQGANAWFRVVKDTKIIVKRRAKTNCAAFDKESQKRDVYYKDSIYYSLLKIMQNKLKNSKATDNPFLCGWSGVLLYGPPGTGKTLLVHETAHAMDVPLITLSLVDVVGSSGGGSECVRRRFKSAIDKAPSVIFIDEIDSLCPVGEHRVSRDKDLTRAVISGIQLVKTAADPVLLIAATSRIEGVSPKLRCSGRFDKELLVPVPTAQQRSQILNNLISSHRHNVSPEDITQVAQQAYGFSGADLNLLLKCAWLTCVQRNKANERQGADLILGRGDLEVGMAGVLPTILRQDFQAVAMVRWTDIWGYEALKSKLQMMIRSHIAEPETYPLRGLLLYGPPGCSKTMFVKALVKETSFSFFPVKCSDLLSKYVGETEKSLSKIFGRARQVAPSIIFMDEVDSLCGDRSGGSGLVSELLSLMSETAKQGNVLVIGATNRPHVLDEALLKPGCLEQVIHVDLPNYECRCQMWSGILTNVPGAGEISIERLSEATAGYSGAEITGVYQHAAQALVTQLAARKENQRQDLNDDDDDSVTMTLELILNTVASLPPRTPSSFLEKIKEFSNSRCSLSAS